MDMLARSALVAAHESVTNLTNICRQGTHPSEQAIHNALGEAGRSVQNRTATAAPFKTHARSSVV